MVIGPGAHESSDKTTSPVFFLLQLLGFFSETEPERGHKNSNVALSKASLYEGDSAGWVSSLFFTFVSFFSYICVTRKKRKKNFSFMQSSFFRSTSLSLVCPETIPISQNAYINSKKKS